MGNKIKVWAIAHQGRSSGQEQEVGSEHWAAHVADNIHFPTNSPFTMVVLSESIKWVKCGTLTYNKNNYRRDHLAAYDGLLNIS